MPRDIITTTFTEVTSPTSTWVQPRDSGAFTCDTTLYTCDSTVYTCDATVWAWWITTVYDTPRKEALLFLADEIEYLFADWTQVILAWWIESNILVTNWD